MLFVINDEHSPHYHAYPRGAICEMTAHVGRIIHEHFCRGHSNEKQAVTTRTIFPLVSAPASMRFRNESTLLELAEVECVSSFQPPTHFQPRPFLHEHRPRPSRFSCRVPSRLAWC